MNFTLKSPLAICFVLLFFVGCMQNEHKTKELELKEKELALKEKELEIQQNNNTNNTSTKQPATTNTTTSRPTNTQATATIKGKGVIMRQLNSVESAKMGNFDENEAVTITGEAKPQNQNQAIAAKPIKLYNDYNGKLMHTLNKGKALVIDKFENNKYYVSYQHPDLGKLYAMVEASELESISNEIWYKVKRNNGQEGWVLGKFVNK